MGKGKIAVQVAHGAVLAAEECRKKRSTWYKAWLDAGQAKIAVRVDSLEDLLRIKGDAEGRGLPVALVIDRGLTQLPPGTATCLAIGPAPSGLVDPLAGSLKLL